MGFVFEIEKCIGCRACEMACAQKNDYFHGYREVKQYSRYNGEQVKPYYLSESCHHCTLPECARVCPEQLYWRDASGLVIHKLGNCQGCEKCLSACPYGAPKFNQVLGKVNKCNACQEYLEKGQSPRCVHACPTGALSAKNRIEGDCRQLKKLPSFQKAYLTEPNVNIIVPSKE